MGLVVCANAILMGIEADLGLLGPAGPTWTGAVARGGRGKFLGARWLLVVCCGGCSVGSFLLDYTAVD